nr:hypothetical protein orf203 [uncultured bacterium]
MPLAGLATTAAGSVGGLIGEPRAVTLPPSCPVSIFVCPVRLPVGCLPPGTMPGRIGAGSALDADTARNLCLLEGVERYSLQYRADDPPELTSAVMTGARQISRPIDTLRLGHPSQRTGGPVVDSRGCSVGANLPDAALRGLLELTEHDALGIWRGSPERFYEIDPRGLEPTLDGLLSWLGANGFRSRIFEHLHISGATAYVAVCSDADGGRPATGSAAGLDARRAAAHACVESVVAWFNLAAILKNPSRIDDLPPDDRLDVDIYRGTARGPPLPPGAALQPANTAAAAEEQPETAFQRILNGWGIEVAVFDLSRPETGIVTARVVQVKE